MARKFTVTIGPEPRYDEEKSGNAEGKYIRLWARVEGVKSLQEEGDQTTEYTPILASGFFNTFVPEYVWEERCNQDLRYFREYACLWGRNWSELNAERRALLKKISKMPRNYSYERDEVACVLFKDEFGEPSINITKPAIESFLQNNIIYTGEYGQLASPLSKQPTNWGDITIPESYWISADIAQGSDYITYVVIYTTQINDDRMVQVQHIEYDAEGNQTNDVRWSGDLRDFLGDIYNRVDHLFEWVPMQDYRFLADDWPTPSGTIRMAHPDMLYANVEMPTEEIDLNDTLDFDNVDEESEIEISEGGFVLPSMDKEYFINFRPKAKGEKKSISPEECPIIPSLIITTEDENTDRPVAAETRSILYVADAPAGEWEKENAYTALAVVREEDGEEGSYSYQVSEILKKINYLSDVANYNKPIIFLESYKRQGTTNFYFNTLMQPTFGYWLHYNNIYIWTDRKEVPQLYDNYSNFDLVYQGETKNQQYLFLFRRDSFENVNENFSEWDSLSVYCESPTNIQGILPVMENIENMG